LLIKIVVCRACGVCVASALILGREKKALYNNDYHDMVAALPVLMAIFSLSRNLSPLPRATGGTQEKFTASKVNLN